MFSKIIIPVHFGIQKQLITVLHVRYAGILTNSYYCALFYLFICGFFNDPEAQMMWRRTTERSVYNELERMWEKSRDLL
jgi:hypothetical protein